MLFDDTYQTISSNSTGIFRDKGSKFLAYAYPISHEDDFKQHLSTLRNENPKARHFCWAQRWTNDRSVFRINDDGEPSGTAGRPILNCLLSANLSNVLVVVVRYFGGTLLGVPGLINAYKSATLEAIGAANIIVKSIEDIYNIQFDYSQMNELMSLIKEEQLLILKQDFNLTCTIEIAIRQSKLNVVLAKLQKLEGLKATYLRTV